MSKLPYISSGTEPDADADRAGAPSACHTMIASAPISALGTHGYEAERITRHGEGGVGGGGWGVRDA